MKAQRNADIVAAIRAGATGADLTQRYGISRQRVSAIWKRAGGSARPRSNASAVSCRICGGGGPRKSDHTATPRHREARRQHTIAAFWARVERPSADACWSWAGAHFPTGYSACRLFGLGYAHRVAYFLTNGPIPAGLTVDHLCRNRGCVNPAHLEAVSSRENTLRSPIAPATINAAKTHCPYGHPYAGANLMLTGRNERQCRTCHNKRQRARYHRHRIASAA